MTRTDLTAGRCVALGVGAALLCSVACVHSTLPVRPAPPASMPALPALGARAPRMGRVLVDAADGPAEVVDFEAMAKLAVLEELGAATTETPPTLCVTPCWIAMPYGRHSFRLVLRSDRRRSDLVNIPFEAHDLVYRRALGRDDSGLHGRRAPGFIMMVLGAPVSAVGGLYLFTPFFGPIPGAEPNYIALIFFAAGLALEVTGIAYFISEPSVHERGSEILFDAPATAPAPGP